MVLWLIFLKQISQPLKRGARIYTEPDLVITMLGDVLVPISRHNIRYKVQYYSIPPVCWGGKGIYTHATPQIHAWRPSDRQISNSLHLFKASGCNQGPSLYADVEAAVKNMRQWWCVVYSWNMHRGFIVFCHVFCDYVCVSNLIWIYLL